MIAGSSPEQPGGCEAQRVPSTLTPRRCRIVQDAELFQWLRKKPTDFKLTAPFSATRR